MCYTIPGKVKKVDGDNVTVDYFGEEKKAINEMKDISPGDYIYAQGGYVIEKVPPKEAQEVLSAWKEMFDELREVDLRLSSIDKNRLVSDKKVSVILDKVLEGNSLNKKELSYLLDVGDESENKLIYDTANFIRQKHLKNSCCVHGIIEISNYCEERCKYCGISVNNEKLKRYKMSSQEIVDTAVEAVKKFGFKALVLQSGKSEVYSINELAGIITEIKREVPVLICISFDEIGMKGLKQLFQAGARGLLLRFETSNPKLYEKLHLGKTLDTRIFHLRKAYEMGYLIMTGGLIGIPGQTNEDIINDIYLTKKLNTEMYSFGPFLPHPETPLYDHKPPSEEKVLKTLALARLIDPKNAKVLVTTAFETLNSKAREEGLMAGANSVMLNVTPVKYRKNYSIYPDKMYSNELISDQIDETISLLKSIGRAPTDLGMG